MPTSAATWSSVVSKHPCSLKHTSKERDITASRCLAARSAKRSLAIVIRKVCLSSQALVGAVRSNHGHGRLKRRFCQNMTGKSIGGLSVSDVGLAETRWRRRRGGRERVLRVGRRQHPHQAASLPGARGRKQPPPTALRLASFRAAASRIHESSIGRITAQEAKVVSQWPVLQRARDHGRRGQRRRGDVDQVWDVTGDRAEVRPVKALALHPPRAGTGLQVHPGR